NDSIQEFRVISSNAPAEFGRNLGGVVNVVTHRGTRTFHGSAYGYFANDALNADGPLSIYNGTTFDQAASYAGAPAATTPPPAVQGASYPLRYNDYVNIARNNGYCTDSITVALPNPSTCVASGGGANRFFDPAALLATHDSKKYPFDSKQFGVSAGGSVLRETVFLFGSYEGTRIDNPNPIFERVPSSFDKSYNPTNAPTTFASSPARTMFAPNNPDYLLGQAVMSLFPASNVVGVPGVLEFFQGSAPNFTNVHNILLRGNWRKSDRTTISLRYVTQVLRQLHDNSLPEPATADGYPGNGAVRHALNQNFVVGVSQTVGASSMINEFRFGVNRFNVRETPQDAAFDARRLGVAGSNFPHASMPTVLLSGLDARYSGAYLGVDGAVGGWPEVIGQDPVQSPFMCLALGTCTMTLPKMAPTLDSLFPFARIGAPLDAPTARVDTSISLADNLSFARGSHDMKIGFSVRVMTNEIQNGAYQRGFVYSSNIGEFGHDSGTCNQICTARTTPPTAPPNSFLRPSFDFARFDNAPLEGAFLSWSPALFFQDTWRMSPKLTFNLGVRYEYASPPRESLERTWNFDPVAGGLIPSSGEPLTVDPYGNLCGSQPLDRSTPRGGVGFPATPWTNCKATGNPTTVSANPHDFAPRFGMSWDVFGHGRLLLRGGVGMFWDQLPASSMTQLLFNRPVTTSNALYGQLIDPRVCPLLAFGAANCGLGNSMVNPARRLASDLGGTESNAYFTEATFPFAMYSRDTEHDRTPFAIQSNVTVQSQISNRLALELGYAGTVARRLPVIFNSRAAEEFDPDPNSVRPLIHRFPLFTMTHQAESTYHSLVARVRAAQWRGLRLNSAYVFSRSMDNGSSSTFYTAPLTLDIIALQELVRTRNAGSSCLSPTLGRLVVTNVCSALPLPNIDFRRSALTTTGAVPVLVTPYAFPQDPFHFLTDERGRSDFDVTQRLVVDYTWEVPSPRKGQRWSPWLDQWLVSGILVAQSGQPFSIFSAPSLAVELTQRVNITGNGPALNMSDPNAAITSNGLGVPFVDCGNKVLLNATTACTGNSGRNVFTGPNYINLDFAVQKRLNLQGENKVLTFRAELYNLFNRANYYNPISKFSADGVNQNPDFGKIKSAHDPRKIQFAARFSW
ncbi:MAG: hypothetical protein ABIP81_02905, partial [Terriglobales bacterium]